MIECQVTQGCKVTSNPTAQSCCVVALWVLDHAHHNDSHGMTAIMIVQSFPIPSSVQFSSLSYSVMWLLLMCRYFCISLIFSNVIVHLYSWSISSSVVSYVLYALMVYLYARMMCACVYALTACFQVCCTCLTASASCSSCEGDTHLQCVVCDSGNWCFSPSHCMTDCVDVLFYRQWTMRSWRRWKRHLKETRHLKSWLLIVLRFYPKISVAALSLGQDIMRLCPK